MSNKLRIFQNLLALSAVTLIIIVWSTVTYLAFQNKKYKLPERIIASYEECVNAGNTILESYPAICITKDGKRFVQDIVKIDNTAVEDWKTYKNDVSGFEFKYPSSLEIYISDNANSKIINYNLQIGFSPKQGDNSAYNIIDILVSDQFDSLDEYLATKACNYNNAIITDTSIGGQSALSLNCPNGLFPQKNVLLKKDKYIYQIFATFGDAYAEIYTNKELESLFNQILSTFKFFDTGNPTSDTPYTCPENGWVNCQPILSEKEQQDCTREAFDWYETNCPNYEGAAY